MSDEDPPLPFQDQFHEFASFHFSHVTLQEGSLDMSGEETHASRLPRVWRSRDKNCPQRHFVAPGAALVLQPFVELCPRTARLQVLWLRVTEVRQQGTGTLGWERPILLTDP